jgi:hypothetical protein
VQLPKTSYTTRTFVSPSRFPLPRAPRVWQVHAIRAGANPSFEMITQGGVVSSDSDERLPYGAGDCISRAFGHRPRASISASEADRSGQFPHQDVAFRLFANEGYRVCGEGSLPR